MYSAYVLLNANFKKIMMKIHLSVRYEVDAMWFAYLAKHIFNDMWYENRREDPNNETERVVKTDAKLI